MSIDKKEPLFPLIQPYVMEKHFIVQDGASHFVSGDDLYRLSVKYKDSYVVLTQNWNRLRYCMPYNTNTEKEYTNGMAEVSVMLLAFACELLIKAVLQKKSCKWGKIHSLSELFREIPEELTSAHIDEYNKQRKRKFYDDLDTNAEAFINIRYSFDPSTKNLKRINNNNSTTTIITVDACFLQDLYYILDKIFCAGGSNA